MNFREKYQIFNMTLVLEPVLRAIWRRAYKGINNPVQKKEETKKSCNYYLLSVLHIGRFIKFQLPQAGCL
jgi:hypothetical protein